MNLADLKRMAPGLTDEQTQIEVARIMIGLKNERNVLAKALSDMTGREPEDVLAVMWAAFDKDGLVHSTEPYSKDGAKS